MTSWTSNGRRGGILAGYLGLDGAYDEFVQPDGLPRAGVAGLSGLLGRFGLREFQRRQSLANSAFLNAGVTFSVYSDQQGGERVFPFDLVPRVITAAEWATIERGLEQRVRALNLFLQDVYGPQRILKEKAVAEHVVLSSSGYLERLHGATPPQEVHVHIAGIDLIRDRSGAFLVLEDNARTPSGVSYVLENRGVMKRALPGVFARTPVRSVDDYPSVLRDLLQETAPDSVRDGRVVVLTPGPYNSAYFEHSFLARRMGCDLVHAADLFVRGERVYLKTTGGPEEVSVIYRRVDDDFLDPEFFRPDSVLGVPGLMGAYLAGNVTLANAPGNGVADDKGVYPYVPQMIRFYLSEEPLLGQVQTYHCGEPAELAYVLENLGRLVVKAVDGSGGYGMLMGPSASAAEIEAFRGKLCARPEGYIAQPLVDLSTAPTWVGKGLAPRRLDLRPFVLTGKRTWVLPGGLTRVALREDSYVVNSSQGGGSKDTWVLGESGS